ncbi:MAG TPA: hypothetical protein VIX73_19140 [Kofleriaceae bacterium]|jgi:hypothetical protein
MTISGWRELGSEHTALYSPIGLRLVDDFTGKSPLGRVRARLDRQVGIGLWAPTDLEAVLTPSSTLTWPGLGREWEPTAAPTRRYRARITADQYRPDYLQSVDGLEFDTPPWNDDNPPNPVTAGPVDLYLFPAPTYAFPTWVRALHGFVQDASGTPVVNVLVRQASLERSLTDERGTFALPLRWATSGQAVDAIDVRTGRSGSRVLNLPADLQRSVTITIV